MMGMSNTAAAPRSTLPASVLPAGICKRCSCCGAAYSAATWSTLRVVGDGPWSEDMGAAPGTVLDVRVCAGCDSSIAIEVPVSK